MEKKAESSDFSLSYETTTEYVHLSGGLSAGKSREGHLIISPTHDGKVLHFPAAKERDQRLAVLRDLGLRFIGVEVVSERNGLEHSQWHPHELGKHDSALIWSGLSHATFGSDDTVLEKIVRNVWFSLKASALRLRDVSRAYQRQNELLIGRPIKKGMRFSNVDAFDVYLALHSALVEMCSTRDYLAQFVCKTILTKFDAHKMSQLPKNLRAADLDSALAREIISICDRENEGGWMARLSEFRNLIVHETPISHLGGDRGLTAKEINVESVALRTVVVPVPRDPITMDGNFVDALSYIRLLYAKLADFSNRVGEASGLSTELAVITDDDLVRQCAD